jgi:hypothetical protein
VMVISVADAENINNRNAEEIRNFIMLLFECCYILVTEIFTTILPNITFSGC